jgi:3-deoxy-D-manno-octulosonic-acid transferase
MYFLYSLVLSLLFLALLPYFVYQAARHRKYASSFKERMGWLPESVRSDGRKTIWVHAVSVGEFLAARPLIDRLTSELPDHRIVISTATLTGQRLARSKSPSFDASFYFPFDWKFAVWRALAWVEPSVVVILETELWPNFLRECRRRGVVTVLANGRISPRSFRRYVRVRSFIRRVIEDFSLMVMQSEADADRARQLGAARVRVCGNLKYDFDAGEHSESQIADLRSQISNVKSETSKGESEATKYKSEDTNPNSEVSGSKSQERLETASELDDRFALSSSSHLIVAGSTAPEEENLLLAALRQVRSHTGLEETRLLIAPRHPERFNDVASLIARSSFTFARRSQAKVKSTTERGATQAHQAFESEFSTEGASNSRAADVVLLDSIGELASVYRFAAVVFVGGSLVPRGGHNIIEPAAFAKPIIIGPHTENFREIVSDFARNDAVVQITVADQDPTGNLASWLIRLLSDRDEARAIGERARDILLRNRGATECTVSAIEEIMKTRG